MANARTLETPRLERVDNRDRWNRLIIDMPYSDFRQAYEWAEVRRTQGWQPHRLAVVEGDHCLAAISFLSKRLPGLGVSILYGSGGPLLRDWNDRSIFDQLLEGVRSIARAQGAIFIRIDPKIPDDQQRPRSTLMEHGFNHLTDDWTTWNAPRIVMRMCLGESESELKKKIRRRFREHISAAPAKGLRIVPATSLDQGWEFHEALAAAGRRKGLPVRGRDYFERLWQEYLREDRGVLLVAEHDGNAVGGLIGVRFGNTAHMLYVTQRDRPEGGRLNQGPVLYWEFIHWAKSQGCTEIDWGGVGTQFPPEEDDPGYGVFRFKKGFNSSLVYLGGYYDLVFSRGWYKRFRFLEKSVSAVAWTARARLNEVVISVDDLSSSGRRKLRQFQISANQRGIGTTLYWAAFGYLKPNRFRVLARDLAATVHGSTHPDLTVELWDSARIASWRAGREGLTTEFFQNDIDGVELCSVALIDGEVAGLIWIYRYGDNSRLFSLRDTDAELNNGYVFPKYRNKGVFKQVIDYACGWLEQKRYLTAYAMVHWDNEPSLRAFRDIGFEVQGKVSHFLVWRPKFRTPEHESVREEARA